MTPKSGFLRVGAVDAGTIVSVRRGTEARMAQTSIPDPVSLQGLETSPSIALRTGVAKVACVHLLGPCPIGETSPMEAAAAPHSL